MIASAQPVLRPWFPWARRGWMIFAGLTLGLMLAGIPRRAQLLIASVDPRALADLGLSAGQYAGYTIALSFVVVVVHLIMAGVIFWRCTNRRMALLVAFALVANGALTPLALIYTGADLPLWWQTLVNLVIYIGLVTSMVLLYVFPDGRFVPPVTAPLALLWAALMALALFWPQTPLSLPTWPIFWQLAALTLWSGSGTAGQVYRYYRVSRPDERQQAKWALLGLMGAAFGPLAYFLPFVIFADSGSAGVPNILFQRLGGSFFSVSLLVRLGLRTAISLGLVLFPFSFAIATLRYRLWDIDILIRRTLVYTVLTTALALIYVTSIIVFQVVFRLLTGEGQSPLITVISTLLIAALFTPARHRVQGIIDRHFYRRKYDAVRALAAFAETARDQTDLTGLKQELVATIEATVQPVAISLWLKDRAR